MARFDHNDDILFRRFGRHCIDVNFGMIVDLEKNSVPGEVLLEMFRLAVDDARETLCPPKPKS